MPRLPVRLAVTAGVALLTEIRGLAEATSRDALSVLTYAVSRVCLTGAGCAYGLGAKWAGSKALTLPMAAMPAIDHAAMPAKAVPAQAMTNGRNRRRKDRGRTILLKHVADQLSRNVFRPASDRSA